MTSDIAKPQTTQEARPETFRSHLPAIAAATAGTVLAAVLGSLIGAAGTIAGVVIGSLASGTCSWWAERGIRRSTALATARAEAIRTRHLHASNAPAATQPDAAAADTGATTRIVSGRHGRPRPSRRWAGLAAIIAAAFIGGAIAVTVVEGAAGKPLSAVVQGKPGHGTTLGGGAVGTAAPASPSPSPAASTTGAAATTPAASATPSDASSPPAASTAPAATAPGGTNPVSSTPSPATPSAAAATATATAPG
jgi:hypothetical protein